MLKKILSSLKSLKDKFPLIYSIALIVLVPATLVFNTWWNMRAFERDMDYSVREKVLSAQKIFLSVAQDQATSSAYIEPLLKRITSQETALVSASVLLIQPDNTFKVMATTRPDQVAVDESVFLNQLSWGQNQSYFVKRFDQASNQNVWMVISPYTNAEQQKIGLVNFQISSNTVDTILNRTSRDALIILLVSVVFVVLLLLNHLRFFEQSQLVEKLQQIDKMKDDFISVASHELKTPLTAIRGCTSMIREKFHDQLPPDSVEWFEIIDSSVGRLNGLVNDLLNVSRIEQNRLDFSLQPIDLNALIIDVIKQLRIQAEEKKLTLNYTESVEPVYVLANENRLREVLINLIGNAIKYTLTGSVSVKYLIENHMVRLMVQDTGVGIAPEDKEKLVQNEIRRK